MIPDEMHYILTLRWQDKGGDNVHTWSGTVGVLPGMARADIYADVLGKISELAGITSAVCLFFSLEPNRLGTR